MDITQTVTHVSLCTGYGGIDLGLRRVISSLLTIAYSEIEAFACASLVSKLEAGALDAAPIWTDVKSFPFASFRGSVDILSGGYPCQPFSSAGKRGGSEDPRHLWPFIASGIAAMRPRMGFFENVEGHITLGLRDVVSDLERLGYETTRGIFSASEVGAPHQRKRVFILAHDKGQRIQGLRPPRLEVAHTHGEPEIPLCSSARTGWTDGTAEPVLLGMDDGGSDWVDRTHMLGNGVVPATAALAFTTLYAELRP